MSPQPFFTASEIAAALGCSKRGVAKRLARTAPDQIIATRGGTAGTWRIESLPKQWQEDLISKAKKAGFREVPHLLQKAAVRFEPKYSLAEIAPEFLQKAKKLQQALAQVIAKRNDTTISAAELAAIGIADFKKHFGYSISARQWERLFSRTICRGGSLEEWNRLEIYIDDNARPPSQQRQASRLFSFDLLRHAVGEIKDPAMPTPQEIAFIWTRAFGDFSALIEEGHLKKEVKAALLHELDRLGWLALSRKALHKNFNRKFAEYHAEGVILDKRTVRASKTLAEIDKAKIVARGLDSGGRIAQSYRELIDEGALSPELTQSHICNPSRKSYVPEAIRREVKPLVYSLLPYHHGPRAHQLFGPHHTRDYSKMFAGQAYQGDDTTLPVFFWEPWAEAKTGYRIIQGQFLAMIDVRSLLCLNFLLHSERGYNSRIIRTQILHTHDAWGLPDAFYFERNIWKRSKILTGGPDTTNRTDSTVMTWGETERGLRELGIKFQFAKLPRAKVVEGVFRMLQTRMERLPGYAGRDQRTDTFERVMKSKRECESGHAHPSKFFLSKDQLVVELEKLMQVYNQERQEGQMLQGLSPLEAWNKFNLPAGTTHYGERCRYLLAHHRLPMRVTSKGIKLRPSLGGGEYVGEATGKLVGTDVLVYVQPDALDYIGIKPVRSNSEEILVVPCKPSTPAFGGETDEFLRAEKLIHEHNTAGVTIYRSIAPHLAKHHFRKVLFDQATVAQGEALKRGIEEVRAEKKDVATTKRKLGRLATDKGLRLSARITDAEQPTVLRGLEWMREIEQKKEADL